MAIKTPSILPELTTFVSNSSGIEYPRLLPSFYEAGWQALFDETDAVGQADGTVLVRFDVLVGRDNAYEKFSKLSVKVAPGPGPVSVVARRIAADSLPYLFFGRLPPVPAQTPPVEVDASEGEGDIVLDLDDDLPEAEDRGFTSHEDPPTFSRKPVVEEPLPIVDHLEPDGVPIFADLYSVGGEAVTADVVIKAVLEVIEPFTIKAQATEQLLALYNKNADLQQFMLDFGTQEEREALKTMLQRAMDRLSAPQKEVRIAGGGARRRVKAA